MKKIIYLLFMLAAGVVTAHGQGALKLLDLSQGKLHLAMPPALTLNGLAASDKIPALVTTPEGPIRTMRPDNMPCLVPDLARVERMPVRRLSGNDPMPNGMMRRRTMKIVK